MTNASFDQMSADGIGDPQPVGAALFTFAGTAIVGALLGFLVGAAKVEDGGTFSSSSIAFMTEQPMGDADKTFNWLIFGIFIAAGIIAGAVAWAGSSVVLSQRKIAREQIRIARAQPPKS